MSTQSRRTPRTPRTPNYSRVSPTTMTESWRFVDGEDDSFDASILQDEILGPVTPNRQTSFRSIDSNASAGFSTRRSVTASSLNDPETQLGQELSDSERLMMQLREPMEPTIQRLVRTSGSINEPSSPRTSMVLQRGISQVVRPTGTSPNAGDTIRQRNITRPRVSHGGEDFDNNHFDHDDFDHENNMSSPRRLKKHARQLRNKDRFDEALPGALFGGLSWSAGVVGHAFCFVQKPLALLLAVYLFLGGVYLLQTAVTQSLVATFSPLCNVPGANFLPICSSPFTEPLASTSASSASPAVEFEGLMSVQDKFEQVLERSADGVSLPLEMKNSETAVRDLRSLVQFSELPAKNEMMQHFDGYIEVARKTARDLQLFNTHVGTAVDAVISINRWTLRFLDSAVASEKKHLESIQAANDDERMGIVRVLMAPFDLVIGSAPVPAPTYSEAALLEKYIEHTAYVSDRITRLIVEAQYVLGLLSAAEDHLSLIYAVSNREEAAVSSQRDAVKWTLKTLIGGNSKELNGLDKQLKLLRKVDVQRGVAVAQVSALIVELESMQAGLEDLRERVAGPELAMHVGGTVPLQVHIDTIEKGLERLDGARNRMRSRESERLDRVLGRGGGEGIEGR